MLRCECCAPTRSRHAATNRVALKHIEFAIGTHAANNISKRG